MNLGSCLSKKKFVSFDVFDTLLKRSVAAPFDLFQLIEQYCENTGMNIPAGFAQKRKEAERLAFEKKGLPVSLDEIYSELRDIFGIATEKLKELELRFEMDGIHPNRTCVELLYRCVESGKTVVLISDMYLPSCFIISMLEKCGIRDYKKLYVSCEMGACKSDGSLFRAVMNEMHIRPPQLLHIGDNWKADFLLPLSLGIRAVHISRGQRALFKRPKRIPEDAAFSYRTLRACIRNCSQSMTEYEKKGCEVFGPQLYGFAQWLLKRLRENNIRNVYFMARDGYTMKQAFDKFDLGDISTYYLFCSRRSYQVPIIWIHPKFDDVIRPFINCNRMTLREFLTRIGLIAEDYRDKANAYGLKLDNVYKDGLFFSDAVIRRFYNSIRFDVEKNSKIEYYALVEYLKSFNMNGKIAVVDIGYQGTMQYALKEIALSEGWNVNIKGFYYGVDATAPFIRTREIDVEGYLYDDMRTEYGIKEKISVSRRIFEAQYLARHGSVEKFAFIDGKSIPVLFPYEYQICDKQISNEEMIISAYQSGGIRLVEYILTSMPAEALNIDPNVAMFRFIHMGTTPTIKEARFWGDMRFMNDDIVYIARPSSIFYYLIHWKALKNDIKKCCWKIGFLRRLFYIKLPYYKIILLLRKWI